MCSILSSLAWLFSLLSRFKWTMRVFGFILILLLGVANLVSPHTLTLHFAIPLRLIEMDVGGA